MAIINGKYEEINNVNLLEYLIENKYRIDRIVVDYNGDIVKKLDFEKYKYCYNWGRLSFDLYCVGAGMKETLREPEFYNKKEIK